MDPIETEKAELHQRMVALVRKMADEQGYNINVQVGGCFNEARAIAALLPEPVDPDLLEARRLNVEHSPNGREIAERILAGDYDGHPSTLGLLASIKRGRQLERETTK